MTYLHTNKLTRRNVENARLGLNMSLTFYTATPKRQKWRLLLLLLLLL